MLKKANSAINVSAVMPISYSWRHHANFNDLRLGTRGDQTMIIGNVEMHANQQIKTLFEISLGYAFVNDYD